MHGAFSHADGTPNTLAPMHGLRLNIKEDAMPMREQPHCAALEEVAARGLLAAETWQWNRSHISLKATIDVPLFGAVIEQWGWIAGRLSYASRMAFTP